MNVSFKHIFEWVRGLTILHQAPSEHPEGSETTSTQEEEKISTVAAPNIDIVEQGHGGDGQSSIEVEQWKVSSASVVGPSHLEKGKPCDDAVCVSIAEDWCIAVASDGAGSVGRGAEGAFYASHAISARLSAALLGGNDRLSLTEIVDSCLDGTRDAILRFAEFEQEPIGRFSATIVGYIGKKDRGIFFHIGDGLALAWNKKRKLVALSTGSESEYVNETSFLTDRDWREQLQFTLIDEAATICLMTDGVSPFAMESDELKSEFFEPIANYAARKTAETTSKALAQLLDTPDAKALISDDKSLVWIESKATFHDENEAGT